MSNDTSVDVTRLVDQLASDDMLVRMKARKALVEIGPTAAADVCRLADADDDHVRWECAKTLSGIADPASIDTLIRLLEDSEEGTRWDAAIGLIKIGRPAVAPLLRAIVHRCGDYTIIGGARHVMHEFSNSDWGSSLKPVYEALNSFTARESAPVEAERALQGWEGED